MAYTRIEGDYGRTAGVDQTSSALCSISTQHARIHAGKAFVALYELPAASVGDDIQLLFVTPKKNIDVHFMPIITALGETKIELFEKTTKVFADGNKLVAANRNRNSDNKSDLKACYEPTGSGNGTKILAYTLGKHGSLLARNDEMELILKRDTKYLLRITSLMLSGDNDISVVASWYETETATFPEPTSTTS